MQKKPNIFDLYVLGKEYVSPREFLRIADENHYNIKDSRFIPPSIGDEGFGQFEIEWKIPRYPEVN